MASQDGQNKTEQPIIPPAYAIHHVINSDKVGTHRFHSVELMAQAASA